MAGCFGNGSQETTTAEVGFDEVFGSSSSRPSSAVERRKEFTKPSETTIRDYNRLNGGRIKSFSSGSVNGEASHSYRMARQRLREKNGLGSDYTGISLDYLLQNDVTVNMFHDFCDHLKATEELSFWTEVEMFQNAQWKAFSVLGVDASHIEILRQALAAAEPDGASSSSADSLTNEQYAKKHSIALADVECHQGAHHIFSTYLSDSAEEQVCVSSDINNDLTDRMKAGKLSRGMFRSAQRECFRDMEKGIFQQFLQHCSSKDLKFMDDMMTRQTANSPALATVVAAQRVRRRSFEKKKG